MTQRNPARAVRTEAFDFLRSLYLAEKENLGRMLRFYLRDTHSVEDLVQQSYMELHKALQTPPPPRNPRAYLFQVARNLSVDQAKRRKAVSLDSMPQEFFRAAAPTQADVEPLLQALNNLKPAEREVLTLKVFEEFTFAEIADITGQPQGTVHSHYRRGVDAIRRKLGSNES